MVPLESYQTTKIYSPILLVKLRGDVIFHLGSVIILVVSGTLLWLGGRSEPSGSVSAFWSPQPAFSCVLPLRLALTAMNEMASSPLLRAGIQIDLWVLSNTSPKG